MSSCVFRPAALAALLAAALAPAPAGALSSVWIGTSNGLWTDPARWTTNPSYPNNGTPPGTSYEATIDATGANYTVTLSSAVSLNTLLIDSPNAQLRHTAGALAVPSAEVRRGSYVLNGGTLGAGTWNIGSGGTWATLNSVNQGGVTWNVAAGGTLGVGGANTQLRINSNSVVNLAGRIEDGLAGVAGLGRIRNQGQIIVDGGSADFDADRLINDPTGRVRVLNGGDFDLDEVTWTNDGLIEITNGSMILGSQSIQLTTSVPGINNGTVRVNGGFLSIGGENNGLIEASNATLNLYLQATNAGTIDLENVDLRPVVFRWSDLGNLTWSGTNNRTTLRRTLGVDVPEIVFDATTGGLWSDGGGFTKHFDFPTLPTLRFLDGTRLTFGTNDIGSMENVAIVGDVDLLTPNARGALRSVDWTGQGYLGPGAQLDLSGRGPLGIEGATLHTDLNAVILAASSELVLGPSTQTNLFGARLLGKAQTVNICFPSCRGRVVNHGLVSVADASIASQVQALEYFRNEGTLEVAAGAELSLDFGETGRNLGLISLGAGSTTTVTELANPEHLGSVFINEGTIHLDDATLVLSDALNQRLNTGTLSGTGTIQGDLEQNGTLAPGASPGQLDFIGDLVMGSEALLEIELGGASQAERDLVVVDGDVTLGGVLAVSFLNGFEDEAVGPLVILDGLTALAGAFANVASGGLLTSEGGERSFQVFYGVGSPYAADDLVLLFSEPAPEPAAAALTLAAALLAPSALRRRGR